jgi:hypothetical protein
VEFVEHQEIESIRIGNDGAIPVALASHEQFEHHEIRKQNVRFRGSHLLTLIGCLLAGVTGEGGLRSADPSKPDTFTPGADPSYVAQLFVNSPKLPLRFYMDAGSMELDRDGKSPLSFLACRDYTRGPLQVSGNVTMHKGPLGLPELGEFVILTSSLLPRACACAASVPGGSLRNRDALRLPPPGVRCTPPCRPYSDGR